MSWKLVSPLTPWLWTTRSGKAACQSPWAVRESPTKVTGPPRLDDAGAGEAMEMPLGLESRPHPRVSRVSENATLPPIRTHDDDGTAGAQLSCLMSWSAAKSTWTEGPMVEAT